MFTPLLTCLLMTQTPEPPAAPVAAPVLAAAAPQKVEAVNAAPEAPKASRAPISKVEDDGLLAHEYFGAVIPFTPKLGADFLWIKEGFSLKGKRITYGPWDVKVLKAGRQEKDTQRATDLARLLPDALMPHLRRVFQGVADWELGSGGDYRFEARIVDANAPNKASKLVFGWLGGKDNLENVTWDMKLVDAKTGDAVVAFHHRMVKVNTLGSLDSSLRDWAEAFPKKFLEAIR